MIYCKATGCPRQFVIKGIQQCYDWQRWISVIALSPGEAKIYLWLCHWVYKFWLECLMRISINKYSSCIETEYVLCNSKYDQTCFTNGAFDNAVFVHTTIIQLLNHLGYCHIYVLWKTNLISIMMPISITKHSISSIAPGGDQDELKYDIMIPHTMIVARFLEISAQ